LNEFVRVNYTTMTNTCPCYAYLRLDLGSHFIGKNEIGCSGTFQRSGRESCHGFFLLVVVVDVIIYVGGSNVADYGSTVIVIFILCMVQFNDLVLFFFGCFILPIDEFLHLVLVESFVFGHRCLDFIFVDRFLLSLSTCRRHCISEFSEALR
jgi:hypothetical protein